MTRHDEKRVLPYRPDQLYEMIADIEKYPEFLPWCQAARIRKKHGNVIDADLVIAFLAFREKFGSRVNLNSEDREIDVHYLDGPFKTLTNSWKFFDHEEGCEIRFFVEFEFKSKVLEAVIGKVFDQAMRKIVSAFEDRAKILYA